MNTEMHNRQDGQALPSNDRSLAVVEGDALGEGLQYYRLYYIPISLKENLNRYVNEGTAEGDIYSVLRDHYVLIGGFPYTVVGSSEKLAFESLDKVWRIQLVAEYIESQGQPFEPDLLVTKQLK